jgi:hypothetical protein
MSAGLLARALALGLALCSLAPPGAHDRFVAPRSSLQALVEQAVEDETSVAGSSSVEAEDELVQVGVEVLLG